MVIIVVLFAKDEKLRAGECKIRGDALFCDQNYVCYTQTLVLCNSFYFPMSIIFVNKIVLELCLL